MLLRRIGCSVARLSVIEKWNGNVLKWEMYTSPPLLLGEKGMMRKKWKDERKKRTAPKETPLMLSTGP